jgi:hypothetical protein
MTQMEIIQIQVSSELARRLRPYQRELPRILEWGLRRVERGTEAESAPPPTRTDVLAALRSTGILVELDPAIAAQYRASLDQQEHTPVRVKGKPLSEMIIEERDRQWANSQ